MLEINDMSNIELKSWMIDFSSHTYLYKLLIVRFKRNSSKHVYRL